MFGLNALYHSDQVGQFSCSVFKVPGLGYSSFERSVALSGVRTGDVLRCYSK